MESRQAYCELQKWNDPDPVRERGYKTGSKFQCSVSKIEVL